jgi:hypothetical protein
MATAKQVHEKIQRMLANRFGSVKIDKDGDFVIIHESAVTYVSTVQWNDEQTIVKIRCPMLVDAPITPELTHWIAVEGQRFFFGQAYLNPNDDGKHGWVYFQHNLLGDDLDEPELMDALDAIVLLGNKLDNELQTKFGGKLFGADD